jgi:hypothetical protein
MKNFTNFVLILFLLVAAPVLVHAQEMNEGWNFKLGTFFWANDTDLKLENTAPGGTSVSGVAAFEDVVQYAIPSLNLTFAAQKDKLSFHANFFNVHLKNDIEASSGANRGVKLDIYIPEAFVGYEVLKTNVTDAVKLAIEPYAGVRYFSSRMLIDNVGGGEYRDTRRNATDAIFGAIATIDIGEKMSVTLRGDAGGFGWGGESNDSDYFGMAAFNWNYSKNKTITLGYADLKFTRDNVGQGSNINADVEFKGPILSHTFTF